MTISRVAVALFLHRALQLFLFTTVACLPALAACPAYTFALTLTPPESPVYQGRDIRLALTPGPLSLKSAILFCRPRGMTRFQRFAVALPPGTPVVTIPATAVVAPGIDYYLELTDSNGRRHTLPAHAPDQEPFTVTVRRPNQALGLVLEKPPPDRPLTTGPLEIIITVAAGSATGDYLLLLDSTDITALSRRDRGAITFTTDLLPDPGQHSIILTIADPAGQPLEQKWYLQSRRPDHG